MQDSQLPQSALERGFTHGVAVVGLQYQWLLSALSNPLADADTADQIRCDSWILPFGDVPGHHLAAPDVDDQAEVQPHPSHGVGQVGDVPVPRLVWA